jgi:hypothetical protein
MCNPACPVFVVDDVSFQLEHEEQKKPGGFVNAVGKLAGPVKKGRSGMQCMDGPVPVFKNVKYEVDDQQRVNRPLNGLLNLVQFGIGANRRLLTH